jgi:hypothetical protein
MPPWLIPLIMAASSVVKNLVESKAADNALGQITGGFAGAQKTILDSTNKSFEYLDPYIRGGQQDYSDYRHLAKSGYYDTPAPISYQPQAYQNQSVTPTGFDPATMGFGNSYRSMQFQPMGLVSPLALPPMPNLPVYQAPAGSGASGFGSGLMGGGIPGGVGAAAGGAAGGSNGKTGGLFGDLRDSTIDSIEGPFHSVFNLGRNIGTTAADAFRDPAHVALDAGRNGLKTAQDLGGDIGHNLMDIARNPLDIRMHTEDAINTAIGLGKNIGSTLGDAASDTLKTISDTTRDPAHAVAQFGRDVGGTLMQSKRNAQKAWKRTKRLFR